MIVVDMEMPKTCKRCSINCPNYDAETWSSQRHPNCPIKAELPAKHGRLIDADTLISDLEYDVELDARALDCNEYSLNRTLTQFDKDCKENAIYLLQYAPTVVEAEGEL